MVSITESSSGEPVWLFGFGSNMDIDVVTKKKGCPVIEHVGAICKGYRMCFNMPGMNMCEPWFANSVKGSESDEIHGIALCMTEESCKKMDGQEGVGGGGYQKIVVDLETYDGRKIKSFMYFIEKGEEGNPSARYLNILVKGAKEAGLKEDYITQLANHPVFVPSEEQIANRSKIPDPSSLPKITIEELASFPKGDDTEGGAHTAIFGYVMHFAVGSGMKIGFGAHKGRDITRRQLRHFHSQPLNEGDDMGQPPFKAKKDFTKEELDYVMTWFDFYFQSKAKCDTSIFVGFIDGYPMD